MNGHERPLARAFGERLKAAREAAGLTMAALGARVVPPMRPPAIARYETGERLPTWGAVVRLARALGTTPDHFLPEEKRKPK